MLLDLEEFFAFHIDRNSFFLSFFHCSISHFNPSLINKLIINPSSTNERNSRDLERDEKDRKFRLLKLLHVSIMNM